MDKYQKDPNKDYKIKITISELDDSSAVAGEFTMSQIKQMVDMHNLDVFSVMTNALITELEKLEAKKLGQRYYDSWEDTARKIEEENKDLPQL